LRQRRGAGYDAFVDTTERQEETEESPFDDLEEESQVMLVRQVPLGIVFARIIVVSGMGFAAALAIFFLIGAIWIPALVCVGITVAFLFLMFFIERGADSADRK
jgi:fatty acid desaturase